MLKGSSLVNLRYDTLALALATLMLVAMTRFRRTLD